MFAHMYDRYRKSSFVLIVARVRLFYSTCWRKTNSFFFIIQQIFDTICRGVTFGREEIIR